MDTRLISNLIDVSLCLVALFISVRSFDVYVHFRYMRLFILGLSMAFVSLSAAADYTANYVTVIALNTDWFLYIAQSFGFLLIFLSLIWSSPRFLRTLMVLSILAIPLLIAILFLSPFLPPLHNGIVRLLLGSARCFICFMIFAAYFSAFTSKATHFNRFMTGAFLLLSLGTFMSVMQSLEPGLNTSFLGNIGNITDVVGLVALVIAVSWN